MGYGIQNYYSSIQKHGFLRDFQFRISAITGPALQPLNNEFIPNGNDGGGAYLTAATVPGRSITTQAVPFMGLDFTVPGSAKYNNNTGWAVTFRTPNDMLVRNALERMSYQIFDDADSTGNYGAACKENVISLVLLDTKGSAVRQYDLIGVYPVTLDDLSFDLTGDGAPVTFGAALAYQYFRVTSGQGAGGAGGSYLDVPNDGAAGMGVGSVQNC